MLNHQERCEVIQIGLATTGRARRAYFVVYVETGTENGRISDPARDLPGQSAGGGHPADIAVCVDPVAIDRAPIMFCIDLALGHHLQAHSHTDLSALLRVEIVSRIRSPLPFQPATSRQGGVEIILDGETHITGKTLRTLIHQQVMICRRSDRLGNQGRCPHSLQCRYTAGLFSGPVHATGIEHHIAIRIGQAAEADTGFRGVEFDDIDPGDQRVQYIFSRRHLSKRQLDTGLGAAIAVDVAIAGGDNHGFKAGSPHCRGP